MAALAGTLQTPTVAQMERLQSLLKLVVRKCSQQRTCTIKQKMMTFQHVWSPGLPDISSEVAASVLTSPHKQHAKVLPNIKE